MIQVQEEEEDKADEFIFDQASMNWVPKTMDVRAMVKDAGGDSDDV